jgi:curved DNA-binding protein CbpA
MEDYYELLGCNPNSSAEEISHSYRRLALKFHPDKVKQRNQFAGNNRDSAEKLKSATEHFIHLTHAYHTLKDPEKRSRYNTRRNYFREAPHDSFYGIWDEGNVDNESNDGMDWSVSSVYKYVIKTSFWKIAWEWVSRFDPSMADVGQIWLERLKDEYTKTKHNKSRSEWTQWFADIVKYYFDKKDIAPQYHKVYDLELSNELTEKDSITIECSLDFIRKYSAVDTWMNVNSERTYMSRFDLQHDEFCVRQNGRKVHYYFRDNFQSNVSRFRIYDICIEIANVPAALLGSIIRIEHPYEKDNPLSLLCRLDGKSHIYRLEGKGIWNASKRYWGDCFIVLKLTNDTSEPSPYIKIINQESMKPDETIYDSMTISDFQECFVP